MAGTSRSAARTTELQMHKRWKDRETSPERNKVWTEPPNNNKLKSSDPRVPVIYYISRNGQLEHPHFMEVPLSSPEAEGLYLKDVINRLNFLRGKGMASLYSWSCKRSYKNGYVWHDLSENDFIFPAHGQEYILKGSEILEGTSLTMPQSDQTVTYSSAKTTDSRGVRVNSDDQEFPAVRPPRRRNQSWSSFDLHEYKVYTGESVSRAAANASTQTDDKRRHRRKTIREIEQAEDETEENKCKGERDGNQSREIILSSTDEISEISPPPSDSSPETLETLMKADGRIKLRSEASNEDRTANNNNSHHSSSGSGKIKASSVLMQLLSCGSIGFKDCGPSSQGKENGFSIISHYKVRLPRGGRNNNQVGKDSENDSVGSGSGFGGGRVKLEEKEYFSGSIVETKKDEFPALKRSSSYNADRSSQLELVEVEEIEGSRAKCIPRKPKSNSTQSTKIESSTDLSCSSSTITSCSSQHNSKRIVV